MLQDKAASFKMYGSWIEGMESRQALRALSLTKIVCLAFTAQSNMATCVLHIGRDIKCKTSHTASIFEMANAVKGICHSWLAGLTFCAQAP